MLVEATNAGSTPHDTMNFTKFRTTSVGGSNGGSTDKTSTDADGIGMVRASAGTCSGSGSSAASRQRIAAVPGPAGTEAPAGPLVAAAAAAPQAGAGGVPPVPTAVHPGPLAGGDQRPSPPAGGSAGSGNPEVDLMDALAADSDLNDMLSVLASDPVGMSFDQDPPGASGDE